MPQIDTMGFVESVASVNLIHQFPRKSGCLPANVDIENYPQICKSSMTTHDLENEVATLKPLYVIDITLKLLIYAFSKPILGSFLKIRLQAHI